jgi:N-acetylmuramoyl-L-alanine amidase
MPERGHVSERLDRRRWRCRAAFLSLLLAWVFGGGVVAAAADAPLIAVDVGHSLARSGATSASGRPEFAFNRELALVVGEVLRERGFRTRLIGDRGDADDLTARTAAAAGADFFLSIHHDSVQPQYLETWTVDGREQRRSDRFSGYSLFVSRKNTQAQASLVCAQAIGEALRANGQTPSLHHAEPIRGENRPLADATNGVYFFDDLIVLKTARSPAVLVEAGIILNPNDEAVLREPQTRTRIATALADGLQRCLGTPPQPAGRRR